MNCANDGNIGGRAESVNAPAQIGGLIVTTLVALSLVPVLYSILVLDLKIVRWDTPAEPGSREASPAWAGHNGNNRRNWALRPAKNVAYNPDCPDAGFDSRLCNAIVGQSVECKKPRISLAWNAGATPVRK